MEECDMTRSIDYSILDTMTKAVALGYKLALTDFGKDCRFISENKAARKYGKARLDWWAQKGIINRTKKSDAPNGKITYDVIQLEIANRLTYNG